MDDLIERQAVMDALDNIKIPRNASWYPYYQQALTVMSRLPSAQPEIVRCKDCKWWSNDDYRECSNPNYDDGYVTPAGFYCGWAERRTDG